MCGCKQLAIKPHFLTSNENGSHDEHSARSSHNEKVVGLTLRSGSLRAESIINGDHFLMPNHLSLSITLSKHCLYLSIA